MKLTPYLIAAALLSGSSATHAAAPIVDIENAPVPAGLTMEQIQQRLIAGVLSRRGWTVEAVAAGHIEARLSVRSHLAFVDIAFDEAAYSITYKDSHNLDYKPKKRKIHANYNKWIGNLNAELQKSLFTPTANPAVGPGATPATVAGPGGAAEPGARGSYGGGVVTIPATIDLAPGVNAPKAVSECRIDVLLAQWLADSSTAIQIGDVNNASHYMELAITEIHMPGGGGWSGPKWMELTGALREGDGDVVSSFRAKRFSTVAFNPLKRPTCQMLQRAGKAIARDVGRWLQHPSDGAELGNAR